MESLSETKWDVVISGTGLQQSLLALALSRSGRNVLHVDPNDYYGGPEAAFSLQEAEDWVRRHEADEGDGLFRAARVVKSSEDGLSFSRSYSLALSPQVIHTRSKLLSQLVSSKAFRQIEFLAVGSLYICEPASESAGTPSLSRIPSTREDVFTNTAIPARSKRALMKFLKFVLEYDSDANVDVWKAHASEQLASFLASEFKLDQMLQTYIVTMTFSLDGQVTVEAGLAAIKRHLTSMGVFGTGFAAVYPKWGGLSEVAQVACRAGAVGGAVYMLGTGVKDVKPAASSEEADTSGAVIVDLDNDVSVQSATLVRGTESDPGANAVRLTRLTAIINAHIPSLFETVVDSAPTPAVAVVAFPSGSVADQDGKLSESPIYAMVHSSETGECPAGQCIVYLSTINQPNARQLLEAAQARLLAAVATKELTPKSLYQLSYEQAANSPGSPLHADGSNIATFPPASLDIAFNDSVLDPVQEAWNTVTRGTLDGEKAEYMVFADREGADDEDEM